jgi:hypothetical protein
MFWVGIYLLREEYSYIKGRNIAFVIGPILHQKFIGVRISSSEISWFIRGISLLPDEKIFIDDFLSPPSIKVQNSKNCYRNQ